MERSSVWLKNRKTGAFVPATLVDQILETHLDRQAAWRSETSREEHGHWDWREKCKRYLPLLAYQGFAVECEGELQGLMIVRKTARCRLPGQAGKHCVFIEYLETAPQNRRASSGEVAGFSGIGTIMVAASIRLSDHEECEGRIALHALPQAETFYRDRCGMSDLGPDAAAYPQAPLRYFEMTSEQAKKFIEGSEP